MKQLKVFKGYVHEELPSTDELLEFYKKSTLRGLADRFGYTRERMRQILKTHPDYEPRLVIASRNKEIRRLYFVKGISQKELVKRFNLSKRRISQILDLEYKPKTIGCDNCRKNEYARGLCKACYQLWISRGKPNLDVVKEKVSPWANTELKPIGCEKCKTNLFCRGLCKTCYSRWIQRRNKPELD